MSNSEIQVVGLTFRRGLDVATMVTDGSHYATFEKNGRILWSSMARAIAYLESHGFAIATDEWIN